MSNSTDFTALARRTDAVAQVPLPPEPLVEAELTWYDLYQLVKLLDIQLYHWTDSVIEAHYAEHKDAKGWPVMHDLVGDSASLRRKRAQLRRATALVDVLKTVREALSARMHGRGRPLHPRFTRGSDENNRTFTFADDLKVFRPHWVNSMLYHNVPEYEYVETIMDPRTYGHFPGVHKSVDPAELLPFQAPYGKVNRVYDNIGWNVWPEIDWFNAYFPGNQEDTVAEPELKRRRLETRRLLDLDKMKLQSTAGQLISGHAQPEAEVGEVPTPVRWEKNPSNSHLLSVFLARALGHKPRPAKYRVAL